MISIRALAHVLLVMITIGVCSADSPESLFQRGVEAFRQGDWEESISRWHEIEKRGLANGELYYNLGSAYYRMGEIGKSLLYYERARQLLPRDPDVDQNLELARMATIDRIEPPVRLVIWDWVDQVRDSLSLRELSRTVLIVGLLTVIGVGVWMFGPVGLRRRLKPTLVLLLVLYGAALGWYAWRTVLDSRTQAIVLEVKVDVYSAPDSAATQVFTLHEGTKVRERGAVTEWTQVVLADGRTGWVPTETIERI